MDRAVILGTFEFVGFQLCKALLDEGYEIDGIHINRKDRNSPFLNEKRFEIGRNANFKEMEFSKWLNSEPKLDSDTMYLIDFYDFYMNGEGLNMLDPFFLGHLEKLKDTNSVIILLLPIQFVEKSSTEQSYSNHIIGQLEEKNVSYQAFYLPAIYGPWQSEAFLFHQYLRKELEGSFEIPCNDREWIKDAIYIEDVVKAVLKEDMEPAYSQILKSDITCHWNKCANYLSIPKQLSTDQEGKSTKIANIDVRIVKSSIAYSKGLENQKSHLNELLIWKDS